MDSKRTEHLREAYGPTLRKNFRSSLSAFIQREFPQMGGPMIVELFVDQVEAMVQEFFPPASYLKMGQVLWFAVAKEEKNSQGKSMASTKLVPVILTLISHEDMKDRINGTPFPEIKRQIKARLCREAYEQGGVLSRVDLSLLTQSGLNTVSKHLKRYQQKHNCVLPYRGTVHDMGTSFSHKAMICKKRMIERKSVSQTAQETYHSPEAISRYEVNLNRVLFCLKKDLSIEETSFVTRIAKGLVLEYQGIGQEIEAAREQGELDPDELPF